MFMVLKIQLCEDVSSPQTGPESPCNFSENHRSFCLLILWKLETDKLILSVTWKCKGPITDLLHWILKLIEQE